LQRCYAFWTSFIQRPDAKNDPSYESVKNGVAQIGGILKNLQQKS
jgi:hypothetical protein